MSPRERSAKKRPTPELSVVIPVYRSADCLLELQRRLEKVLSKITPRYEILYVEDAGGDSSWEILGGICRKNRRVRAFQLSRNFGQHAAITAGLSKAQGLWAVVMDGDLQDEPEFIPALYEKAKEGFDVVLTRRTVRKQSLARILASRFYFLLLNLFNEKALDGDIGTFSVIRREVIDAYLSLGDQNRHYLFILKWLGFRTATLDYNQTERYSGKSSYNFRALVVHAFNGVFFQTTTLLRWIIYLGLFFSFLGFLLTAYFIFLYFMRSTIPPGYTSLATLLLLIGGFTIVSLGVTGLYIGKIFDQVKRRPLFVFRDERGAGSGGTREGKG